MLNPISMVGNGFNVRVSGNYSNAAPSQQITRSFCQPGNGITPSNCSCSPHGIAMADEIPLDQHFLNAVGHSSVHEGISTLPQIYGISTNDFQHRNIFRDPVGIVYQADTMNEQTLPQEGYFVPFETPPTGSAARYMPTMPGGPKTRVQRSVGARLHTPGQKNLASSGDEWSVPALIMGHPSLPPIVHPGNNLHGTNFQDVMSSEEVEQINAPYKKRKHSSPLLPGNAWCSSFEESGTASTQCSPPSP